MADNELEGTEVSDEVRAASESSTSQRLAALSKEEKQLILIGVFLFYGTRRVTQKKISALKTIIHHNENPYILNGMPFSMLGRGSRRAKNPSITFHEMKSRKL